MSQFWIDHFQICGKSPKSIWRIWWELFRSSIPTKIIALQCSAFSVNWCKCPILIGKIQQMSTFWIDYFQICGKSLKSIWRIWWALFRSSSTTKRICSPMQCFFCKLVQMSNFDRTNSANEQILDRLFPNLRQILKSIWRIWWTLFWSSSTPKRICSTMQSFFCKLAQISNFDRLN